MVFLLNQCSDTRFEVKKKKKQNFLKAWRPLQLIKIVCTKLNFNLGLEFQLAMFNVE
jgi:hypothetical protein